MTHPASPVSSRDTLEVQATMGSISTASPAVTAAGEGIIFSAVRNVK